MQHKIDFSTLNDFAFAISSPEDFDTVSTWMDNRFVGLPLFHKSVHLKVKQYDKIIADEKGKLVLPESIYDMAAPHLQDSLGSLLMYIQRGDGIKNFGLLYLSVKLMPHLLKQEINRYKALGISILNPAVWLGSQIEVPVLLAVASRKTDVYYESLAIGLHGVHSYGSALTLAPSGNTNEYLVHAGLNAYTSLEHIDHIVAKLLKMAHCQWLPKEFFNRYLKNHLIPEREQIVKKLCEYVFHGCQSPKNHSHLVKIQQLGVESLVPC